MRVIRGTPVTFEATFVDVDGDPLVAGDPNATPSVQIKDAEGSLVATSVGRPIGNGKYQLPWFVPETAELTTDQDKWSIDWFFITIEGHNRSSQELFEVVDKVQASPSDREWTLLTRAGTRQRVSIQLDARPSQIGFDMLFSGSLIKQIFGPEEDTQPNLEQIKETDPDRPIGRVVENGQYKYFYDTDLLNEGEYQVFWRTRESTVSPVEEQQRVIRVPEFNFWTLNLPLRILIDKLHKRIGQVQSYSESDLYEYMQQGLGYVNMIYPQTSWTLSSVPRNVFSGLRTATLLGAAIWGLNAQQILEIELSFSHGGQTVTLEYNHDYSGVLSNMEQMLQKFTESKKHLYRQQQGVGRVGVRPKNYNYHQRVWRVGNYGGTSPYDVNTLIAQIGLP